MNCLGLNSTEETATGILENLFGRCVLTEPMWRICLCDAYVEDFLPFVSSLVGCLEAYEKENIILKFGRDFSVYFKERPDYFYDVRYARESIQPTDVVKAWNEISRLFFHYSSKDLHGEFSRQISDILIGFENIFKTMKNLNDTGRKMLLSNIDQYGDGTHNNYSPNEMQKNISFEALIEWMNQKDACLEQFHDDLYFNEMSRLKMFFWGHYKHISQAKLKWSDAFILLLKDLEKLYEGSQEYEKAYLTTVSVYFREMSKTTIKESLSYSPFSLLSDVGGTLGLYLGATVLVFYECIVYCIKLVKPELLLS